MPIMTIPRAYPQTKSGILSSPLSRATEVPVGIIAKNLNFFKIWEYCFAYQANPFALNSS